MNTTAAAEQAKVTVATIRTWCRRGVIAARKVAGRWVIDATSLAYRISLTTKQSIDRTRDFVSDWTMAVYQTSESITGLRHLLNLARSRDTDAIAGIDPAHVHLTDTQWTQAEQMASFQISCLNAER